MTKHTSGEWEVTESGNQIEIMQKDGKSIAVMIEEPEMMENAHLMASAPELVKELKKCANQLAIVREWCEIPEDTYAGISGVINMMNESISKAEGGA